jgi:hypothetical protein
MKSRPLQRRKAGLRKMHRPMMLMTTIKADAMATRWQAWREGSLAGPKMN